LHSPFKHFRYFVSDWLVQDTRTLEEEQGCIRVNEKVICAHERKKFVVVGSFITVPASAQHGTLEFRKTPFGNEKNPSIP
jgi:hypothetical protein